MKRLTAHLFSVLAFDVALFLQYIIILSFFLLENCMKFMSQIFTKVEFVRFSTRLIKISLQIKNSLLPGVRLVGKLSTLRLQRLSIHIQTSNVKWHQNFVFGCVIAHDILSFNETSCLP